MTNHHSIYHQMLTFLIENDQLTLTDNKLHITFTYTSMEFNPPKHINGIDLIYIRTLSKVGKDLYNGGILRVLEIEPVQVIKNYLQIRAHYSLSINTQEETFNSAINQLSNLEQKIIVSLGHTSKKKLNLYLNNETHVAKFNFDCNENSFFLSSHSKNIIKPH